MVAAVALTIAGAALSASAHAEALVDRVQLESWADQYYGQAVAQHRAGGFAISVVQDGELLFSKGYGYADAAQKRPIDPNTSGFIVGSVTKTFVATAVAQLVDRGAIASLDDPVNKYLKRAKLPGSRGDKVTIRQLLTHRAGFADASFGFLHKDALATPVPLSAEEIRRYTPDLAMEPGGHANYSNWSFSQLGIMVEDVTGQRLDAYLRANIWRPLGMTHTDLAYPQLPANLTESYQFSKDGRPVPQLRAAPHPWIAPGGALVSTAGDMALYMRAQMAEGEGDPKPLMSPARFRELHRLQHQNAPIAFGFAHAFWIARLNDASTLEHGGGAPGFQTMMVMIPSKRFAFFVSTMLGSLAPGESYSEAELKGDKIAVREATTGFELRESFVKRFLKEAPPAPPAVQIPALKAFSGVYWTQQRPFASLEVVGQAFNPAAVLKVSLAKDGKGLLVNGWGPYHHIGGGVFQSPTGKWLWQDPYTIDHFKPNYLAFGLDKDGGVESFYPGVTDQAWVRVSPIFNPKAMLFAFLGCGLVVVTGFMMFAWPHRGGGLQLAANILSALAALPVIAIPSLILLGFPRGMDLTTELAAGDKGRLWGMVAAANAEVLAGLALLVLCVSAWRPTADEAAGWGRVARRLHVTALTVAVLGLLVSFQFFRLLGINMPG